MINKKYLKDQIKIGRFSSIVENAESIDYFPRIIEEMNARNYTGLLKISHEFGISISIIDRILDRMAHNVFRLEQMPKLCEISTLSLMLSDKAKELKIHVLKAENQLDESDIRKLYFSLFSGQSGEKIIGLVMELRLDLMFDFIWAEGLKKFFNSRYRVLKDVLDNELETERIIREIGLTALLDEDSLIKRYSEARKEKKTGMKDLRDDLAIENMLRAEANNKIEQLYDMIESKPCNFRLLRKAMLDFNMDLEADLIEREGINCLKDYIHKKAIIGAKEVALRYDFVCPAVSETDITNAQYTIKNSFFAQAQKTKKGKYFLRGEVLFNLNSAVKSGECYKLNEGYMLAVFRMRDGEEHYIYGRYPLKIEKDAFALSAIGFFYMFDVPTKAVTHLVKYYLDSLSQEIRWNNSVRKMLFAFPLVIGISAILGVLYFIILSSLLEAATLGGGILLIGMAIAWKNGYDEEVKPGSHQKIPGYIARKGGVVTASSSSLDLTSAEKNESSPEQQKKQNGVD